MSAARDLGLLALLAAGLLLAGLGSVALTDRDEGANAEAAREMLVRGTWLTPTLNEAPRFQKPALVYWLMAAAYATLGTHEAAARLPSALAAVAVVFLQYGFARWALGPAVGRRAALILLLGVELAALGRMALTDAVLVLWTTAAGYALFRAAAGPPPTERWYGVGSVALGLALLTKGPVGVLVPLLGFVPFLLLSGRWRTALTPGRVGWSVLLLLAVGAPWYLAMLWEHGVPYLARARAETLGRIGRTVTGPGGTVLFYVPVLLVGLFPWSAFLPGALHTALRGARHRACAGPAEAAPVFAAIWVLAVVSVFSLFQTRLPHYVAPVLPPAALLVAATWPARVPALPRLLLGVLGSVLAAALLGAWWAGPAVGRLLARAYPVGSDAALPASVALVGGLAGLTALAALVREGARAFRLLATLTTLLLAVGLHLALPAWSREFVAPAGRLVARVVATLGPCDHLVAFGPPRPSLLFYGGRPVTFVRPDEAGRLATLANGPRRLVVVTAEVLRPQLPAGIAGLPVLDAEGGWLALGGPRRPCPPDAAT